SDQPKLSIMSFYAFFGAIKFGVGNLAGVLYEGTPYEVRFTSYGDPKYFYEAIVLSVLTVFLPPLVYDRLAAMNVELRAPRIGRPQSDEALRKVCLSFFVVNWLLSSVLSWSTIPTRFLEYLWAGATMSIFVLVARWSDRAKPPPPWSLALPLVVVL